MKVFKFLFIAIVLMITVISCTKRLNGSGSYVTEQRAITQFTGIESEGDFNIVAVNGLTPSLTITAEDNILPELSTVVEGGTLRVHFRRPVNVRHGDVTITVTTSDLKLLKMVGSGTIKPQGIWAVDELVCDMLGSGEIFTAINGNKLKVNLSGSGLVTVTGKIRNSELTVSGSGNIRSYSLESNVATASVNGSGNCELTVVQKLEANISGSGRIFYKGNPVELIQNISGSGKIVKQ